jgi:hypothetical protein
MVSASTNQRKSNMKKFAIVIATLATLVGSPVHAQTMKKPMGSGASAGSYAANDNFAWGIAIGALVVLGVVVGVTVAAATGDSN